MKKITPLICIMIIFCSKTFGQSQILFNYQWHLSELKVGGVTYVPPVTGGFPDIVLSLEGSPYYNMYTNVCNDASAIVWYLGEDTNGFTIQNYSHTLLECNSQETTNFDDLYLNNFWANTNYFFLFPNYPAEIKLEIYSFSGNKAVYYGTTLNTISLEQNQISIYPNPSKEHITIHSDQISDSSKCVVYNLLGEKVFEKELLSSNQMLDISQLSAGVYIVEVNFDRKVLRQKIIKL